MPAIARRTVVVVGVGTVGAMALGIEGAAEAASTSTSALPLRSEYARALGKVFTAKHAGHTYRLRLKHIHDVAHSTPTQRSHSFNLVFVPVGSAHVPDGIYVLRSPHVRTHSLFLSSLGRDRALQALVNRTVTRVVNPPR